MISKDTSGALVAAAADDSGDQQSDACSDSGVVNLLSH